ncbi:hypothetical protein [Brevundimonas sp.]|jgi:hypothetical protein|uniref:hypothetical protein n=1 Tax=Brevundimonas sp. TaxID=1871086 RepID=UPI00262A10DD|nr:hypothetical protein [Brevundimonas sp.]
MSEAPAFFIPFADSAETADEVYATIRATMAKEAFQPTERRVYRVMYQHNGRDLIATVGEKDIDGETVIAILEGYNPGPIYMICTPTRGVVRGDPILAGDILAVVDFSQEEMA